MAMKRHPCPRPLFNQPLQFLAYLFIPIQYAHRWTAVVSKRLPLFRKSLDLVFLQTHRRKRKKKKVSALVAVKPENQEIEKERFWKSTYAYNPQFTYKNPVTNKTLQKHGHPSKKILPIVS